MKDDRATQEAAPVREFLRYLGVEFAVEELIVQPKDGDVNVRFRDARLQIVERLEDGRRRQEETRQSAERLRAARRDAALEMPTSYSVPMGVTELLRKVVAVLEDKIRKTASRAKLDGLVYVNVRGRHLHPVPEFIDDAGAVAELGWRSVSVLWPPYAIVLYARPGAPMFLRTKARRVIRYTGMPWEESAVTAQPGAVAQFLGALLETSAAVGYVALGALVLATRARRDATAT